jgi:hypothetical protein
MKRTFVSIVAVLSLLLVFSAVSATPLAPDYTKVGVKVGQTAIYRSSFTGQPWNKTKILVYGIIGTVVYLNQTNYMPDGVTIGSQGQTIVDVLAGSFLGYAFLIAANLTTGDALYSGAPETINETTQMVVAGALRTINHGSYYGGLFDAYWDKATGLMTQLNLWFLAWGNFSLLSTTAWAPDTVPSLLNMTTIALIEGVVIIVLIVAVIVVASRRRRA